MLPLQLHRRWLRLCLLHDDGGVFELARVSDIATTTSQDGH